MLQDERNNAELIVADKNLQAGNDFHVRACPFVALSEIYECNAR